MSVAGAYPAPLLVHAGIRGLPCLCPCFIPERKERRRASEAAEQLELLSGGELEAGAEGSCGAKEVRQGSPGAGESGLEPMDYRFVAPDGMRPPFESFESFEEVL